MKFSSLLKILTLAGLVSLPRLAAAENYSYFISDFGSAEAGIALDSDGDGTHPSFSLRLENSLPAYSNLMLGAGLGYETDLRGRMGAGLRFMGYFSFGGEVDTDNNGARDSHRGLGILGLMRGYISTELNNGWRLITGASLKNSSLRDLNNGKEEENPYDAQLELGLTKSF